MSGRVQELLLHAVLALAIAVAWVLLFICNKLVFSSVEVSRYVNWIFLPAAIRMLAVLWLGWAGALGLFVGALLTNLDMLGVDPGTAIALSALSSLPGLLAATAVAAWLRLPLDLAGLRSRHLMLFGVAGAAASVVAHTLYFMARAGDASPLAGVLPMFVGDALGTTIVLMAASALLRRSPGPSKP